MKSMVAIITGLALCGADIAAPGGWSMRASDGITYTDPERTFFERFIADPKGGVIWQGGEIKPKNSKYVSETNMASLNDCSDGRYRCVYGLYRVFAVPRDGLLPDSKFVAGGAVFHVEKCIRGDDKRCQVALISSDCQGLIPPDKCVEVPGGRAASTSVGRVGYFIFNEDYGITSYGSVEEPAKSPESKMVAALDMVLRGETGLLFQAKKSGNQDRKPGRG